MLRVISLRATATGKGTQKNYRATNNENDCDPNERTGIGQNCESAAVTLRTPANARQQSSPNPTRAMPMILIQYLMVIICRLITISNEKEISHGRVSWQTL